MRIEKLNDHLHLVDLETAGIRNFIASYIFKGDKTAIIETGPTSSIPTLLTALDKLRVNTKDVKYVAISHIHLDHGGGAGTLIKNLPNAKIVVHPRGAAHLTDPTKLWQQSQMVLGKNIIDLYNAPEPAPANKVVPTPDGTILDIGNGQALKTVETIGHASHHQSYQDMSSGGIFPGDAAGIYLNEIDTIVPTTPAPFRMDLALSSIDKLMQLSPTALYYSHFGQGLHPTTKLQTYKNQLKLWAKIAKKGIQTGQNQESIIKQIADADPAIQRSQQYVQEHEVLSKTVLSQSVQGIIGYFQETATKQA
jgi:glyoxylase-like metal-dependent hydrolase (beta-lactamase superfamily II)